MILNGDSCNQSSIDWLILYIFLVLSLGPLYIASINLQLSYIKVRGSVLIAAAKPGATLEATLSYRCAPLPTCTEAKWQSHYGPRLMSVSPCSVPLLEPKSFTARTEATVIMCANIVALLCSPPLRSSQSWRRSVGVSAKNTTASHASFCSSWICLALIHKQGWCLNFDYFLSKWWTCQLEIDKSETVNPNDFVTD